MIDPTTMSIEEATPTSATSLGYAPPAFSYRQDVLWRARDLMSLLPSDYWAGYIINPVDMAAIMVKVAKVIEDFIKEGK